MARKKKNFGSTYERRGHQNFDLLTKYTFEKTMVKRNWSLDGCN